MAGHLDDSDAPERPLGGLPTARISHGALRANVARFAAPDALVDLRADAWGHGVIEVAATLRDAGIPAFLIDPAQRFALIAAGMDAASLRLAGDPTIPPADLYGLPPASSPPVLRLSGTVLSVKPLRTGEGVSYGYTHRAGRDTHVALVTGGYAQGIVRALGNRVTVAIAGARHPIIGRVAMDVCVVDIGDGPVRRGDEVVYVGDATHGEPSLAEWADATGLHPAELVTAIGRRAHRKHVA